MVVSKIISKIFSDSQASRPHGQAGAIEQSSEQERKKRKEAKLVDLAHEALVRRAAGDSADLDGLVKMGLPNVKREKFKSNVKKKVWDVVSEGFGDADSKLVEEITDSIVEVSEADEYYMNMFDAEKA